MWVDTFRRHGSIPLGFQSTNLPISAIDRLDRVETSGVDWSEVHAVRLLGVALAALILLWAIRRMFGRRK